MAERTAVVPIKNVFYRELRKILAKIAIICVSVKNIFTLMLFHRVNSAMQKFHKSVYG